MKLKNVKKGQMVRHRRMLAFGYVMKRDGRKVIYVDDDAFQECDAAELDPVAVIIPVLVQVTCPCCGVKSSRKPFDGWVVENCEECGEGYAAGPFLVGPPLEVVDEKCGICGGSGFRSLVDAETAARSGLDFCPCGVAGPHGAVLDEIRERWAGKPRPVWQRPADSFEVNESLAAHKKMLSDWVLANLGEAGPC